jgi:hypothetical protein
MTDTAIPTAPADRVACAHCGHLDSGTYCSACGKELADDASRTVAHEVWDLLVVDRLNDAREFATTTWYVAARPLRFFRTVLARPAARASHVFPEPVPPALPRGMVQSPVVFYALSFVTAVLAGKITGTPFAAEIVPGLDDDFNNELSLLVVLAMMGIYGVLFRLASGRRISAEEAAIVTGYTVGASTALTALAGMLPGGQAAGGLLSAYLMFGVPLIVLPRLYGISRPRVIAAQVGAGLGALFVAGLAGMGVTAVLG